MDYKEKYMKALEWMQSLYDGLHGATKEEAEHYFPELKESEDEQIRKKLICFVENWKNFRPNSPFDDYAVYTSDSGECDKFLAWLEKQEEPKDKGEISDGYHTFNELYEYRKLYNAAFFNLLPKELVHKSKKHHDGEECFGGGWFIVMANLPTGQISNHYELKDWDLFQIPEKEVADEWDGHTPQDAADRLHKYLLEKQGENKHTDEVESKFHEGEWIIHQGTENIYQVVACIDNQYQLKYGDNYTVQKCTDVDRCARLWTIADAKDGDVLVHNGYPFIFMGIKDGIVQALEENLLEGTNPVNFGEPKIDKDYHPATKEQRDVLFAKMKEAGYKWDSEKKELKKIGVKSLDGDKVVA